MYNKILLVLVNSLILVFQSQSQLDEAYLSVESNIGKAKIFIDSNFVGEVPLYNLRMMPGEYELKVVYPDKKSWNQSSYSEFIQLKSGQNVKRYVELENIFTINSNPANAKVYIGDSLIGTTPVIYFTKSDELIARVEKENYESVILKLDKESNYYEVMLLKKEAESWNKDNYKAPHLTPGVYVAGAGAIIFGSAAALLKIKADEHYKNYRKSGDRSELTQVKKFDKLSGISLFLCEISNIILIYLLLWK